MRRRLAALPMGAIVLATACAPRVPGPAPAPAPAAAVPPAPPPRGAWALSWRGAAIGGAWERDDGRRFERREQVVVRRGDDVVVSDLAITVDRDADGQLREIGVSRWQDGPVLDGTARRIDGAWRIDVDGEVPVTAPATAIPFELALRGGREHHGLVLMPGWGFAVARLDLVPAGDPGGRRFVARLTVGERTLEATVRYDADGAVAEIVGGDGVTARRAALDADLRPARPPEVVDGSAITVEGATLAPPDAPRTVVLLDATAPPPPSLPGQRPGVRWSIALDPRAPGAVPAAAAAAADRTAATADRTAAIIALTRRVADDVSDDLAATAVTTGAARTATHGDCTTHALRFAALAADAGIASRVVTGLRLDGDALVRHRWNLAWTGARWIAVDPTWAEAPASPRLLGLAVHGARAADLAAADATVFDGLGARAIIQ